MTETARLKLPLLAAAQAQKHVTINEALVLLDLLTGVIPALSRAYTAPPGGDVDGDVYILPGNGTGAWVGYNTDDVVMRIDGGWRRALPSQGMIAAVADEGGALIYWDGAAWARIGAREVLAANRTYYVRTDGDDSNTGLANTAGGAFATLQKAIDVVGALDISTFTVTIKLGNTGTFASGCVVDGPWVGTGTVVIEGDTSTPSNTVVAAAGNAIVARNGGRVSIKHFKIQSSGESCLQATKAGVITLLTGMDFGAAVFAHMDARNGGVITNDAAAVAYAISGGASYHYYSNGGHLAIQVATVTLIGTPAFSGTFARATTVGQFQANLNAYTGAATGVRYVVSLNSAINTVGGGASYFPGNAAGTTDTGGQYA